MVLEVVVVTMEVHQVPILEATQQEEQVVVATLVVA